MSRFLLMVGAGALTEFAAAEAFFITRHLISFPVV
jgi:hypothetical protein